MFRSRHGHIVTHTGDGEKANSFKWPSCRAGLSLGARGLKAEALREDFLSAGAPAPPPPLGKSYAGKRDATVRGALSLALPFSPDGRELLERKPKASRTFTGGYRRVTYGLAEA